jgi:tryptophan-rich sensory protein
MEGLRKRESVVALVISLVVCYSVSALGAVASIQAREFYAGLIQPNWAPPGWVFGPVWTLLYGMMAVAAWLIWCTGSGALRRLALLLFAIQLGFNGLWSWLFFAWQLGGLAFADILILWMFIAATIVSFWRIRPLAGLLLVPYLGWVSFAAALNFAVWQLNPGIL